MLFVEWQTAGYRERRFSVYAQLTVLFYQRQHGDQSQTVRIDVPLLAWSFVKTGASSGQPH